MPTIIPPFVANLALHLWETMTHQLFNFASSLNVRIATAMRIRFLIAALLHRVENMVDKDDLVAFLEEMLGKDYGVHKYESVAKWYSETTRLEDNTDPRLWLETMANISTAILSYLIANKAVRGEKTQPTL